MRFGDLERKLAHALAGTLPGSAGQIRMSPRPRFGWRPDEIPAGSREGGVLLLLYPVAGEPHVLLTVRDGTLPHHPGQISLPGGAVERDESIDQAALREATEEVGLDPGAVRIVGSLSPLHVPVSGFVLHPRVAVAKERPALEPDRREVERILEPALARLADPAAVTVETREYDRRPVEVPYFDLDGEKVWGATAMVLSELLFLLGSAPDPWDEGGR